MVKKVAEYIQKFHMLEKGDTVIVGVSGGADSVCLLSVLSDLRENMGLRLIVAHINHMYRETAVRDEEYVLELCHKSDIPCRVLRMDVQSVAKEKGLSFEEAGRMVRYEFFEKLKAEYRGNKIAVAHNREDCAETTLFHLFRGSNIKGLGGIGPVKGDVIRPLLGISRKEITDYLSENKIPWMEDETNASTDYTRNRIRHNIMPEAEKICNGAVDKIAETAEELRLTEDYLALQTGKAYGECCEIRDGGIFIRIPVLDKLHPIIRTRIFYSVLEQQAGSAKDFGRIHVQELERLCSLQAGRSIDLPYGICAHRTFDGILVRREEKLLQTNQCIPRREMPECSTEDADAAEMSALLSKKDLERGEEICFSLPELGMVRAKLLFNYDFKNIVQKTYTKWFDYDKISKCAVFRKRMEGDYLVIDDKGNHKTLKEYFIQEKIPAYKRDDVWVLADDAHIMWVPGYRISAYYKIKEETERVLEVTIGGREDGED